MFTTFAIGSWAGCAVPIPMRWAMVDSKRWRCEHDTRIWGLGLIPGAVVRSARLVGRPVMDESYGGNAVGGFSIAAIL